MTTQKLITSTGPTRFALQRFEAKVNEHLVKGWTVADLRVERRLLWITAYAVVELENVSRNGD